MKSCGIHIFSDNALLSIFNSLSHGSGNCAYSSEINLPLISLSAVGEKLESVFSLYETVEEGEMGIYLLEHLLDYWPGLFHLSANQNTNLRQLIRDIFEETATLDPNLCLNKVKFLPDGDSEQLEFSDELNKRWERLSLELKYKNRFFLSEAIDIDSISSVLQRMVKTHPKGTLFFRARISEEEIKENQLGKPPREKASSGRANPVGIPYLYLATDKETTYYESRAGLHEHVYIGEFESIEHLSVISLENIDRLGPIEIQEKGFDLWEFVRYRAFLIKLSQELSRPIRKKDSDFDYLPTQYLCELIKSLGFDGVQYQSAMNPKGSNLAVFNDQKLNCNEVNSIKIDEVTYKVSELVSKV